MTAFQAWPSEGTVAHEDLLASVESFESRRGRVVRARVFGGWDVELLPDRCLDVGLALHNGIPVSWVSPVRDRRPLDRPRGEDWLSRFHGGLVTTCGLRGFGPASPERGLHGDASHLPAGEVSVTRTVNSEMALVAVSAIIEDARVFDSSLRLARTVTLRSWRTGGAELEIVDELQNLGPMDSEIGVLYHVNIGAPIVSPGARIDVEAMSVVDRAGMIPTVDPSEYPEIASTFDEHVVERTGFQRDRGVATLSGRAGELQLEWSAATLPYFVQWVYPARGRCALGLEPATSSLLGERSPLTRLRMGEVRRHELRISVR